MELKATFEKGRMNSDVDPILLPKGEFVSSTNMDFFSGVATPMPDVLKLTNNGYSSNNHQINPVGVGILKSPDINKFYYAYKSVDYEGIDEFDASNNTVKTILKATTGRLNFGKKVNLTLIGDLLFFSDRLNQPKRVDITKTYVVDSFNDDDILVMKKAPLKAPLLVMYNTLGDENNLEEKFISFTYRYKYKSGELSAYSPFSRIAFTPASFNFDFSTHTNNGMVNSFNSVDIKFDTGNELVDEVELLFKESGSNSVYLIDKFNKIELGYLDNTIQTYTFDNSKNYRVMPSDQLSRIFDNVPLNAGAQETLGNRIIYGDYDEGRDIDTEIKHTVSYSSDVITNPKESVKTNRECEICISYLDKEGRPTTPLASKDNTVFIKHADSDKRNYLKVNIPHLAPSWANSYRFYIKQSKMDYDVIIPTLFYEDGVYRWVKFEEADKDKINAGDFLVVKRDTSSKINKEVKVKVLESGYKDRNFLRPELTGVDAAVDAELRKITQKAGYYFKIKPIGFAMNYSDLDILEDDVYHNTSNRYSSYFVDEIPSIGAPSFYGDSLLYSGITSSGTYVPPIDSDFSTYNREYNQKDLRFKVIIDTGGVTFSWDTNTTTLSSPPGATGVAIPALGGTVPLSHGVSIVFPALPTGGYTPTEFLVISAKQQFGDAKSLKKPVACLGDFNDEFGINEEIEGGADISLWIKEYDGTVFMDRTQLYSSSRKYDNIEEWWHEEGIAFTGINPGSVSFRRGHKSKFGNSYRFLENNNIATSGVGYAFGMHIFIRGQVNKTKIQANIRIMQSNDFVLMETVPKETAESNLFYEIGDTYMIDDNRYHIGDSYLNPNDINQTSSTSATINLRFFNCYSFGNGVESYKVKDSFNGKYMRLDSRVMPTIDQYSRKRNMHSLTYSGAYSESMNINRLNEFNLSNLNFKELSTNQSGAIRKIVARSGDLLVFQAQELSKVLFGKVVLSNIDGTSNLGSTKDVLGSQTFFSSKHGIGEHDESYAEHNNNFFFFDPNSGSVIRGGFSGLDEIKYGVRDLFKQEYKLSLGLLRGVYDVNKDAYIIKIGTKIYYYNESVKGWSTSVSRFVDVMTSFNDRTFAVIDGDVHEFYKGDDIGGSITSVINDFPSSTKVFESLRLESVNPLTVKVTSNNDDFSTASTFLKREDFYYSDIPKVSNLGAENYGIGTLESFSGNTYNFKDDLSYKVSIGDVVGNSKIQSVLGKSITLENQMGVLLNIGDFILGSKESIIEGASIRGVYAILDITADNSPKHKITSINVSSTKSYN